MKTRMLALLTAVAMMVAGSWAADNNAANTNVLQPPKGHQMALIAFEDLACPACAYAEPLLLQAERNYGVALARHDFIIHQQWSMEAHIIARYYDTKSPQLGEKFRQYIFANQKWIYKRDQLVEWVEKFGKEQHSPLPANYDPGNKLRDKVEADMNLGKALGVHQTPTIYVVTNSPKVPYELVMDQSKLFETIDKVKDELKNGATSAPATVKKK